MEAPFHPLDLIRRKRDGLELTSEEIESFIRSIVRPSVRPSPSKPSPAAATPSPESLAWTDPQIAALLMAILLRGLSARELNTLTCAMRFSGETFATTLPNSISVDKHSTGGVGDKTSLLIAPIIAAASLELAPLPEHLQTSAVTQPFPVVPQPFPVIPMISGRSLGHTGGTLDKLETIPGFRTQLSLVEMDKVLHETRAALVGQTPDLVPADRILYALRDHTATVESPSLICASIMSKKLAAGLQALVLDVKTGSGAFLQRPEEARFLADLMVRTGEASGTRTVALLTSMDQPLGRFAGNWVEVRECVEILKGESHPLSADLIELSLSLAGWTLHLAGVAPTPEAGFILSERLLGSGAAYQSWLKIVRAQGGDLSVFENPEALHRPSAQRTLTTPQAGFFSSMNCTEVGWAVQRLGAGRKRPGDPVSAVAGIEMHAKLGDWLNEGQPLVTLFAEDASLLDQTAQMLRETFQIAAQPPKLAPLVREIVAAGASAV